MKKISKILSLILALSIILSAFCFGTVSAEDTSGETTEEVTTIDILEGNSYVTFTPLQIATDGLDWTKTEFSYEGLEVTDAYLINGSYSQLTDGDYTNSTQIDSSPTVLDATGIATRRLALKIDLGAYYNASSISVDTLNGTWAAGRLVYSYNVYGSAEYDATTILNDENLIGSFLVNANNYWSDNPRETTLDSTTVRYVVIVFNLLGTDPGMYENSIFTDLTDVPVTPATSYIFKGLNNTSSYETNHGGRPFLSEIEIIGKSTEYVPNVDANVLINNSEITISPIQIATDGLDWTASSFSYEGKTISDAYTVAGDISTLTDGDYDSSTQIDSSKTLLSAKEIATRRLGLKIDLGRYYDISSIKVDTAHGTWATGRMLYSYNVYGSPSYNVNTILNDDNLIGSVIVNGDPTSVNYYWSENPRVTEADAKNIRYVVIVLNLLGTDPGVMDNSIMTDLTDVPVEKATSYMFRDVNGGNASYTGNVGRPFLSEIEIYGLENEEYNESYLPGDANGDKMIDVRDLVRMKKYIVGVDVEVLTENIDFDANGTVDVLDLVALRKYLLNPPAVL